MPQPGSIVRCRNREWVLLPSDRDDVYALRPLTGATDEVVLIHKALAESIAYSLPTERVTEATFPLPTVEDLSDAASATLLWQAARLTLREGATPFRSLGRISIRPRTYQFVPLLMALRLDPVRLFIADDVGVGKTIEALLIARELWDRYEIRRIAVLCPPYLCDQWHKELTEKFNLDAVVIRSGTIGSLERNKLRRDQTIYQYYPVQVISIDFVKSDRNQHLFLQDPPDFIIIDEAHGAAITTERNRSQHERHHLVANLARDPKRHLILLTATPHSGVEAAFVSLLSFLNPEFSTWQIGALTENQRSQLARHFIQRTRADIVHDWEGEHCFPKRELQDVTYRLSKPYADLFQHTYEFCSEIVRAGRALEKHKQRVRYWGALALLRCVMSSPAAAVAALQARGQALTKTADEELDFREFIYESADDRTDDELPLPPIEASQATLAENDRRKLRELARLANALLGNQHDTKLIGCVELVQQLLKQGFNPIIWCRYVATAEYVGEHLQKALGSDGPIQVLTITGRIGDEERKAKIDEIEEQRQRVLIATDCLSEGINLQEKFNAAIHYDLPWNPNRLEQREGRVDRYGQPSGLVKTIRFFSPDNPIDGTVIRVLLDKAREIHRALGTYVPVPEESESVTEAVLNALFLQRGRSANGRQLTLEFNDEVKQFHTVWDENAKRERINRTRFAQRSIKPDEVKKELEATDAVLGDPHAVCSFVLTAAQRIGLHIAPDHRRSNVFIVQVNGPTLAAVPEAVRFVLPLSKSGSWAISFVSPTPEGAEYVGRNHRFVTTLARFLLEEALTKYGDARASRCGAIRTRAVSRLTTVLLLRVRYLVEQPDRPLLLSEEVLVAGYEMQRGEPTQLPKERALQLLLEATPDENIPMAEKRELVQQALDHWPSLQESVQNEVHYRAAEVAESHKRIRQAAGMHIRELRVKPQFPVDLLGLLVLQPTVHA